MAHKMKSSAIDMRKIRSFFRSMLGLNSIGVRNSTRSKAAGGGEHAEKGRRAGPANQSQCHFQMQAGACNA
jgi:hypothetical protein